jgi:hypothetical protein
VARSRRTRALLAVFVALLGSATAVHHSGLAEMGMGMEMSMHGNHVAMVACLAILAAAAAVEGLVLVARRRRRGATRAGRRPAVRLLPVGLIPAPGRLVLARDGPPMRLTLCVDRR